MRRFPRAFGQLRAGHAWLAGVAGVAVVGFVGAAIGGAAHGARRGECDAMTFACGNPAGFWNRAALVTPATLALVSLAVALLLAASITSVGLDAFGRRRGFGEPAGRRSALAAALWLGVLFSITLSAKLLLMREVPAATPFWDQWDAEAAALFAPFQHCALGWHVMFSLHNEHRIFFSRLLAVDLLTINGQWDPRLEQVVNAAMHATTAVLVASMLWLASGRRRLDLIVLACALSFALPVGWENTLSGFQSAFYFLLLFSVLALWLTTVHPAWSWPWWLGWLCALCAIATAAGGGLLIALAIAGVALLKLAGEPRSWRGPAVNVAAAAIVFAVGFALASPPLPYHANLKTASAVEFSSALGHALAWPWVSRWPTSLVMWLPFAVLVLTSLYRRQDTTDGDRLVVGLGVWVLLQSAAVAYGRGAGGGPPTSRYMDFISLGFVANTTALLAVVDRSRVKQIGRRTAIGLVSTWLICGSVGADRLTLAALTGLSDWRPYFKAHTENVRELLVGKDRQAFVAKQPLVDLPYPDPDRLATYLQYPEILRILPGSIREPIHVTPLVVTDAAFVPDGTPMNTHDPLARTWGSYGANRRADQGRFESQPIASCRHIGHLQFQVSGYLGMRNHYLAVKDLSSGREIAVRPGTVPQERWLEVSVPCPAGPFAIVAIDAAPDSWFAFREPVEVGWASLATEWLIARSRALLLVSLAMAVLAVRWAGDSTLRERPSG